MSSDLVVVSETVYEVAPVVDAVFDTSSVGICATSNALLVPVCWLPSFALIVTEEPMVEIVTVPVHTPLDQPLVLVLVGLIVPLPVEAERVSELL